MTPRTLFLLGVFIAAATRLSAGAEAVTQKINVLDLIKSGQVTYHINDKAEPHDPPDKIWTFNDDGELVVSGRGFGYVATKQSFKDYHLVFEYKFPGPTFGSRKDKARDNGLIIHGHGPDGSYTGTWMAGIEAQIIEGGTGDMLVLSGKLPDGMDVKTSVTAEIARDPNGQMIWKKGAPLGAITKGRINWEKRSPAWKDEAGFLSKDDVQSRYNEWTRYEVIAQGGTLKYIVNGVLVNEASDCQPSEGKICMQCEGAEMIVRRFELYPLGGFTEKWSNVSASGGLETTVLEPRAEAWTPEQEQKSIVMDGHYEAQLVACEPLVKDPVEMTWDAKGRCFVADMMDYPLGPPPGQAPLSRIQLLLDPDENGRYTRAITYADHVDHVQGLLPYKDGLIATTRTQILFLRDSKGDGVADQITPLVEGFNPSQSQLQVASPRWGLDNCVYFNNGLSTAEIYAADNPNSRQNFTRSNLRWDPVTGKLSPSTGFGQYGGCFDDWGRHYFSSNRNPVMFAVMPYEAVMRNPHAGIAQGWEDIAPTGADTRVYPLQLTHTTSDAHAGTHTAACGLGVYRGDLMPELRGEIFVCEPTAQCVVRYHSEPKGASFKADRVGDHTDFFRSRDEWCRPVNVTTGPDGAMYICDIYRRFIDHSRFFPEQFAKTHNMRAGDSEGRIWRIVPKGAKPRAIAPAPASVKELVAWLAHQNAWQRETAQRLLLEKKRGELKDFWKYVAEQEVNPLFLVHLGALSSGAAALQKAHGLDESIPNPQIQDPEDFAKLQEKLDQKDPKGREFFLTNMLQRGLWISPAAMHQFIEQGNARDVMLATLDLHGPQMPDLCMEVLADFPEDVWVHRAVLSSASNIAGKIFKRLVSNEEIIGSYSPVKADLVRSLASCSAADMDQMDFVALLDTLKHQPGKLLWWKPAMLQGLAEGLPKSGRKLGVGSLAEFVAKPPADFKDAALQITALFSEVDRAMADVNGPADQRLAVLPLVAQRPWEKAEPVLRPLFADGQPPEITGAALAVLKHFSTDKTAPLLYELLPKLGPTERREVVAMLSSGKTLMDFLHRMERGELPKSLVGIEQRWGYEHSSNKEIKALAAKLFGTANADRAAVITNYMDCLKMQGDPEKGHQIFRTICIACHKIRGEGVEVGPDITDVRIKPSEALLTDILDPNRVVEPRFNAYQVDTKDGRTLAGVVASENTEGVTLKLAGGAAEVVQRSNIKSMKCLDQSLMPVGLEAGINKQQMADLLAFLKLGQ